MKTINLHEALKRESVQKDSRSLFERFIDSGSQLLFGGKSAMPNELKGFR